MDTEYNVIFYYRENGNMKYIHDIDKTNELFSIDIKEINKSKNKYHSFMMNQGYEKTHEDLIRYKNDFNIYHKEIMNEWIKTKSGKSFKLDYKKYHNHNDAVLYYFLSYNDKGFMDTYESIAEYEFYIIERCYNAGLITLNLDYKNKPTQCYGSDYSRYYTNLLLDIKIPIKRGELLKLTEIPKKLEFGIYRIRITYKNSSFTNIFNFSLEHHYTSTTLSYLFGIKAEYGLEFELLEPDDEYNYNALIYTNDKLISGKSLFKDWFKSLEDIRKKHNDNKLLKHLMSSVWGSLSSYNKIYLENTENYDISFMDDNEPSEYKILGMTEEGEYKAVKSSNAYKTPLARLKPFLTAFGRLKIMKLIRDCNVEDSVVRIHTDGIVLSRNFAFESHNATYYPKPENKTTGLMVFKNAVYGFHKCLKCEELFTYKTFCDVKEHSCH